MLKKICAILFCLHSSVVSAKETVTIIWGWSPGDSLANISRTLASEANKIQNKYTFIFDVKPGAGGAIAANYVGKTSNTILATSSAFFIRPNLFPTTNPYKITDFQPLLPQCYSPISLSSTKHQSLKNIKFDAPLSIGNSGMGSTTHLASLQLNQVFTNANPISYKGPSESFVAMVSGEIDFDMGFLGSIESWKSSNQNKKISVLGITGQDKSFNQPLLIDQGFPAIFSQITLPLHLVVSSNTPGQKVNEWQTILAKASKSQAVRDSYSLNYCAPLDSMQSNEIRPWFDAQILRWQRLSKGINLEN